jgi:hypothetical protein
MVTFTGLGKKMVCAPGLKGGGLWVASTVKTLPGSSRSSEWILAKRVDPPEGF